MQIVLPYPPASLNPNRAQGLSWKTLYSTKSKYREDSYWIAKGQLKGWTPSTERIELTLTFNFPDKKHRDFDNCFAACKAMLDGLADALGVNDRRFGPIVLKRGEVVPLGSITVEIQE